MGDCTDFVGGAILHIVYFGVALYLVDSEFGISWTRNVLLRIEL